MDNQTTNAIKSDLLQWLNSTVTEDRITSFDCERVIAATAKNLREDNQDRVVFAKFESPNVEREFSLVAVFDGMGGMLDGGYCAELAIASVLANLVSLPRSRHRLVLIEALNIANEDIYAEYAGRGGTTFAGFFVDQQGARSVNVGDSRVYRFDCRGDAYRLSTDDKLGNQFAAIKGLEHVTLDPSIADRLGQHLGMSGSIRPNVRLIEDSVLRYSNDTILVSTDGVHALGDESISTVFQQARNLQDAAKDVLEMTRTKSNGDNATFACASLKKFTKNRSHEIIQRDKLTVWLPNGFFTFVLKHEEAVQHHEKDAKSRSSKKSRKKQRADRHLKTEAAIRVEQPEIIEENKPSQPKVMIEQLTFEPIDINESPK